MFAVSVHTKPNHLPICLISITPAGRKGVPDDVVMATAGSRLQYSCMRPLLRRNAQSVGSIAWRKVGQHEAMPDPLVLPAVSNSDLGQYECFLETNGILLQTVDVMVSFTDSRLMHPSLQTKCTSKKF